MKKVLVIVGPTGVGKTKLSIFLAKKFNGEIISGDSIQVYKGLDIGSAKISDVEKDGIKHYGIDILSCDDNYSVCDFQVMARNHIDEISGVNKLPMIVGGTGLYIKACIYDYEFGVHDTTDSLLYEEYNKKTNDELYEELLTIDENSAKKIHKNNRKRIIRALLIHKVSNESKSDIENRQKHEKLYDAFIVGCTTDREKLYEIINKRVDIMMDSGLEDEVKNLLEKGVTFDNQCMQGIGYKEWKEYFNGNINLDEVKNLIKKNTRNFAKRQYTWFKNQMDVNWIDVNDKKSLDNLVNKIEVWYGQKT